MTKQRSTTIKRSKIESNFDNAEYDKGVEDLKKHKPVLLSTLLRKEVYRLK